MARPGPNARAAIGARIRQNRPTPSGIASRGASQPRPHGRARQTATSTTGYSITDEKITGARKALKAPPSTPPRETKR